MKVSAYQRQSLASHLLRSLLNIMSTFRTGPNGGDSCNVGSRATLDPVKSGETYKSFHYLQHQSSMTATEQSQHNQSTINLPVGA
jgi:hypothetical protein